jgi:hypothetical protein
MTPLTAANPPAPLGFCAKCISRGQRTTATTLNNGTSCCDACALDGFTVTDRTGVRELLKEADAATPVGSDPVDNVW